MPDWKKLAFYAMTAPLVAMLFEVSSLVVLHVAQAIRPEHFVHGFVDAHFDALSEDDRAKYLEGSWDPVLGWDNRPLSEFDWRNSIDEPYHVSYDARGARADDLPPKKELIVTYGDSFTWCDEVSNQETWGYFLESNLGVEVRNYGVGAYGTDQALLKAKSHMSRGQTAPITILGILEENVNRVVNTYRPFYSPHTGVKLGFKPSFHRLDDGRVVMWRSAYDNRDLTLDELRRRAHELAEQEYWVRQNKKLEIRFPYTVQLVRTVAFFASRKLRHWVGLPVGVEGATLWSEAAGLDVMHYLVDEFVESTVAAGSAPVVLFLPNGETLRMGVPPAYTRFASEAAARHPELLVIDLFEHDFDRSRFQLKPFAGHASVYGNRVIAEIIQRELQSSALAALLSNAASATAPMPPSVAGAAP